MEALLALGLLGVAAAVGWSIAERGPASRRRPARLLEPTPPYPPPLPRQNVTIEHDSSRDLSHDEIAQGARPPSMADWAKILAPLALEAHLPLSYALSWISAESAGNPCAVGNPEIAGPDGQPQEIGIAQVYNPDDLREIGTTGAELRAYCIPGRYHPTKYKNRIVHGFSQALSRPLTETEMLRQARIAIAKIDKDAQKAQRDLVSIHAGTSWDRSRKDFWTLVKLQHGLPGLSRSGLPAVTKKLGRPPTNWREFRATIHGVTLDRETEKYRKGWNDILDNAEKTAALFAEPSDDRTVV